MVFISSKSYIEKKNYTLERAAQNIMSDSRHPFTKTNINHDL